MKSLTDFIGDNFIEPYIRQQSELYESLLKSYNPSKLMDAILKEFADFHIQYYRVRPDSFDKVCAVSFVCNPNDKEKIINSENFKSLLNFYNYTLTNNFEEQINGHIKQVIILEPNITGDYTDIVYKDWDGIVYHVTNQKFLKGILAAGLRPKGSNNKQKEYYRTFDERIFLTGGPDWKNNIITIVRDLSILPDDVVILKIDLKKNSHKIKLFRDPIQQHVLGLYTKEQINRKCIIDYYGIQ